MVAACHIHWGPLARGSTWERWRGSWAGPRRVDGVGRGEGTAKAGHQGRAGRTAGPWDTVGPTPLPLQLPLEKCGSQERAHQELDRKGACGGREGLGPGLAVVLPGQKGLFAAEQWPRHPARLPQRQGHCGGARGCTPCSCTQGLPVGRRWGHGCYTLLAGPHPRSSPLPGVLPLRRLWRVLRRPQHHPRAGEWRPGQGLVVRRPRAQSPAPAASQLPLPALGP